MNRAVFLDRDNTIIHADDDVSDPGGVRLIEGAAEAIASLAALGYRIVVVTNQGGVARGVLTEADVSAVNARLADLVRRRAGAGIDRFYYCPYHPEATVERYRRDHAWRKPNPGMLLRAASDLGLDLGASWMVGDSMRDVDAGRAAGARTVLLSELTGEDVAGVAGDAGPDFMTRNLPEAARLIAARSGAAGRLRAEPVHAAAPGSREAVEAAPEPPEAPKPSDAPAPARRPAEAAEPAPRAERVNQTGEESAAPGAPAAVPAPPAPVDAAEPPREAARGNRGGPRSGPSGAAEKPPEAPEPGAPPPPATPPAHDSVPDLLRQVLRELKARRVQSDDLTFTRMVAGVAQIIALGCLVFGMLNADEPTRFFQWLAGAGVGQLIVITLLLAERPPRPPG